MQTPFETAQIELAADDYRKKVERCKELIGQLSQAEAELSKATEKVDGIRKALEKVRANV